MILALAISCSKDDGDMSGGNGELPPDSPLPIVFSCNMQEEKSVTRAGLETEENSFTVYGFKNTGLIGTDNYTGSQIVFPGYMVKWTANSAGSSTTNTNGWEYVGQEPHGQEEQTVKYWDWSAKAYRFFGVTESYNKLDVTEANGVIKLSFKVDLTDPDGIAAIPYYSHLWFSNNNYELYPNRKFGGSVVLEFLQPLCKVRIMFVYEDPTKNDRTNTPLSDISFHRSDDNTIKQKGDVTITYPLTGTGTKEECAFDTEAAGMDGFSTEYTDINPFWYTVLPIAGQGSYTLDINVDGEPKTTIVPAEFMEWKPGYSYTYIFKIHVDGRVSIDAVQSAFTEWSVKEDTYTVYNW